MDVEFVLDLLYNHLKVFCDADLFCVYHLNILLFFFVEYLMLSYFDNFEIEFEFGFDIDYFDVVDFDIVDFDIDYFDIVDFDIDYFDIDYFDIDYFGFVMFDFVDCKIEAIIFIVVNFYFILLEIVEKEKRMFFLSHLFLELVDECFFSLIF